MSNSLKLSKLLEDPVFLTKKNWVKIAIQKLEDLSKFLAIDILPKIGRKEDCIQNRNLLVSQYTFLEVMVFKGIPLTCDFIEKN